MKKFFAFIYRMKYITRWSLMRNTRRENLAEHSFHVSVLAHALAVISRDVFGKEINPERAAACALYHDMPEILTGDLPTPIKYYGKDIKDAYKKIEAKAAEKILVTLDEKIRDGISESAVCDDADIALIVKAADKLDAYIKCREEMNAGNRDFARAEMQTKEALEKLKLPEVAYFMENYIEAFNMTVDEL